MHSHPRFVNALQELSFSIARAETFALLGESGCGKSLTASALIQLLPAKAYCHEHSSIALEDKSLLTRSENELKRLRGNKVAMIFQEPMTSLNPVLTVDQQLTEVIKKRPGYTNKAAIRARAVELLQKVEFPQPEQRLHYYPHQLSGGQKQRVMIAMAIASEPTLLIADEPTTALDVTVQAQILALLMRLKAEMGMAILLITHDLGIVKQVADRVGVMYAGQLVEVASKDAFFAHPKHPYSQGLLSCLPSFEKRQYKLQPIAGMVPSLADMPKGCRFQGRCERADLQCLHTPPVMQVSKEHQISCHHWQQQPRVAAKLKQQLNHKLDSQPVVMEVRDLKVHFSVRQGIFKRQTDVVRAVDGVSFSLRQGETLALVGESGCGKSTLSRTLVKLLAPTDGNITVYGKNLATYRRALAKEIQLIFQDPFSSMNPRMTVSDIILEGLYAQGKQRPYKQQVEKRVLQLLEQVGLPQSSIDRYPHQFSGGQRQRISIARALAASPKIIICDEPTSALDVSVQAQILNLLVELQQQLGLAYLFISHDLSVVSYLADRILVMKEGRIVEQGETDVLISSPKHLYTQQLLSAIAHV